jgi:hypothetical protein
MAVIGEPDRKRLAQFLGMVGSAHDGEALNAVRLANKLLQKLKLQWADVLNGQANGQVNGQASRPSSGNDPTGESYHVGYLTGHEVGRQKGFEAGELQGYHRGMAAGIVRGRIAEGADRARARARYPLKPWQEEATYLLGGFAARMSRWERDFLTTLVDRRRRLSIRQEETMKQIRDKCARPSHVA